MAGLACDSHAAGDQGLEVGGVVHPEQTLELWDERTPQPGGEVTGRELALNRTFQLKGAVVDGLRRRCGLAKCGPSGLSPLGRVRPYPRVPDRMGDGIGRERLALLRQGDQVGKRVGWV